MRIFLGLAVASAISFTGASVRAATISYGATPPGPAISTGELLTNFDVQISVPAFDSTSGSLTAVQFVLFGTVISTLSFENTGTSSSVVTATSSATLTLFGPLGVQLAVVVPTESVSEELPAYDGGNDYAGESGRVITDLTGIAAENSAILTSPGELASFSRAGGGLLSLRMLGDGASTAESSSGNVTAEDFTRAIGELVVTYTFNEVTTEVPEPATLAILGAGLFGFGLTRRRNA